MSSFLIWRPIISTAAASNCRWNTAQDVAPSNFGGFTVVECVPGPPPPAHRDRTSTSANWASSSLRVVSMPSRRFRVCFSIMKVTSFCCLKPSFHFGLAFIYLWLQRTDFAPEVIYLCLQPFCNTAHAVAHLIFNNVAYVTPQCLLSGTECTYSVLNSAVMVNISLFSSLNWSVINCSVASILNQNSLYPTSDISCNRHGL